jgi:hypothetical protein
LPDVSDVFRIIPDDALDPQDRAERRRDRAIQIQQSPTPEIVRAITDILTRIDDVQDALVTLALAGRFAVAANYPFSGLAKATAVAADILSLGNVLRNLGLVGGRYKGTLYNELSTRPQTYSTRFRNTLRTGKIIPTFGELLQVLQTADQLLGVGLQLGPLMGVPVDLFFTALRGGSIEIDTQSLLQWSLVAPAFFGSNPWIRGAGLAAGFAMSLLDSPRGPITSIPIPAVVALDEQTASTISPRDWSIPSTQLIGAAEDTLTNTTMLDLLEQDLSTADHATITLARYAALNVLTPFALANRDGILRKEYADLPVRATFPFRRDRSQLERAPIPSYRQTAALAMHASPAELPRRDIPARLAQSAAPGCLQWITKDPYNPLAIRCASLAGQCLATLALALEGPTALEPLQWSTVATETAHQLEYGGPWPTI